MKTLRLGDITSALAADLKAYKKPLNGSTFQTGVGHLILDGTGKKVSVKGEVNLGSETGAFTYEAGIEFAVHRKFNMRKSFNDGVRVAFGLKETPAFIEAYDLNYLPHTYLIRMDRSWKQFTEWKKQDYFIVVAQDDQPTKDEILDCILAIETDDFEEGMDYDFFEKNTTLIWGLDAQTIHRWLRGLAQETMATEPNLPEKKELKCDTCKESACCRIYSGVGVSKADAREMTKAFVRDDGSKATINDLLENGVLTLDKKSADDEMFAYLGHRPAGGKNFEDCALLVTAGGGRKICSIWHHRPSICRVYGAPNGAGCQAHDWVLDDDEGFDHDVELVDLKSYKLPKRPAVGKLKLAPPPENTKALPVLK